MQANLNSVFAKNTLDFDVLFYIQCNEVLLSFTQVMFKLPKFPTGTSRIMRAKSTSSMSSGYWKTLDTVATWASNTLPRGQLPKGWHASLKNSEGKKNKRFTLKRLHLLSKGYSFGALKTVTNVSNEPDYSSLKRNCSFAIKWICFFKVVKSLECYCYDIDSAFTWSLNNDKYIFLCSIRL